ncbi:hypothetical protein ARMGADRAFT_1038386 [Armillaria gallica]|uniref:Uncharacterized protein n=1 Tax=Armillaria gallica TaxID=47427 RepID=A0A2H3D308_ARMGA|nr:hypothetical protein ARMGADRAFT_1038386 [Armillaria gallica]
MITTTGTRTAIPTIEKPDGEAGMALPKHSSMLQPCVLLKELCFAFKNTLNGIIYTCCKNCIIKEIEGLRGQILSLEGPEEKLANKYGMTSGIDSVEVFDETKARAFSKKDENTISVLKDLHMPYQLRVHLSSFQLPRYFNLKGYTILTWND